MVKATEYVKAILSIISTVEGIVNDQNLGKSLFGDLNSRPTRYECVALPTELNRRKTTQN